MGYSIKGTIRCNMGCPYCYESTARKENPDAGKQDGFNVDKIIQFMETNDMGKIAPNLHGGEPLILPKESNEKLFKYMFEKFGETSVQTNGLNVDEDYIEMFKKYNTNVGVSIDGPDELNMGRWMGNEEKTLKAYKKIMNNIRAMRKANIRVGIIAVISKTNAAPECLPKLKKWLLELKSIGISSGRLNMITIDFPELESKFKLSLEDGKHFYKEMATFIRENDLIYSPFTDVVNSLMGYGPKTCVNTQCDPFHTEGEKPIYGDGTQGNCLRTAKDGVVYLAEVKENGDKRVSNERYVILRQIPMSEGGCGGCRFWNTCAAHCPADAEDGDWRNKTSHCEEYFSLYEGVEKNLKQTLPGLTLVSDLYSHMSDAEIDTALKQGKLNELVSATMIKRRSVF